MQALFYALWEPVMCVGICYFLLAYGKAHWNKPMPLVQKLSTDSYAVYSSCCCGRLHICCGTFAGLSIDAIGIGLCGGHSVLFYCGKRSEVSAGNGWREDVTKKREFEKFGTPFVYNHL